MTKNGASRFWLGTAIVVFAVRRRSDARGVADYLAVAQEGFERATSQLVKFPGLGPDDTGVGWIYEYVLQDTGGQQSGDDWR